jgi:hypothetical protein
MDMFVQTDEVARCQYYRDNSQNVMTKWKCNLPSNPGAVSDNMLRAQDQTACNAAGGVWSSFTHGVAAPQCEQVDWSRVNHLGNGRNGQALSKNISLPTFATLPAYIARRGAMQLARCVYRQRYNMSTDDYDPWNTNSSRNDDPQRGIVSPVRNNPTVDVGADLQGLKLAINTNQFGRTFQDRSHVFYIKPRPTSWATKTILNLGVRGKRCNIVQCYPAVEYDFHPNRFHIPADEIASTLLHVQWTGSNTHNNGDPAGDGQAGNAGEGTEGTDRNNIALTKGQDENFPIPLDKFPTNMWTNTRCYQPQQDGPTNPGGQLGAANNGLDCPSPWPPRATTGRSPRSTAPSMCCSTTRPRRSSAASSGSTSPRVLRTATRTSTRATTTSATAARRVSSSLASRPPKPCDSLCGSGARQRGAPSLRYRGRHVPCMRGVPPAFS